MESQLLSGAEMMIRRTLAFISVSVLLASASCRPPPSTYGPESAVTQEDSVLAAWRLVYAYTRAVDHFSCPRGEIPATLAPVAAVNEAGPDTDIWGRRLRYRPFRQRFEIRSGGPDGVMDTGDDIVALGQIGRDRPCEIRTASGVWQGSPFEPPCALGDSVPVYPPCPELHTNRHRDDEVPSTRRDSVQIMGVRLVRIARGVDGVGRDLGALPLTLQPVPSWSKITIDQISDIWRRPIRYRPEAKTFEVRSAGPDGQFDTGDDIVATGRLGRTIPCAFRAEGQMLTCDELPPPCPEAPGATALLPGGNDFRTVPNP